MDPIHPIVSQPPTIAPVTHAPRVGRVGRDPKRGEHAKDQREQADHERHKSDGDGEVEHIDVTA